MKRRTTLRSGDPEGFLRAFSDEWVDIGELHDVVLLMSIEPTKRRGVMKLCVWSYKASEGTTGMVQAMYSCEYPTAAVETFEACLYRCLIRLERILRDKAMFPMGKA
jgi:hypothetical protein